MDSYSGTCVLLSTADMRPFTSVVNSDLMEHTEPICMYNLPANVGHFVSLRHVKIFFIIRRGKRGQEKRAMLT